MNGFTVGMKRDLIEVLQQMQMSNEVRVIIITGSADANGRGAFCAGDDTMGKPGYQAEYEGTATQPINPGHDSGIQTYDALRWISQVSHERENHLHITHSFVLYGYSLVKYTGGAWGWL